MNNKYMDVILKKYVNFQYLRKSVLVKNFLSLSVLQATNYIFPLITIPYITRIFGPEIYGLLNFASSFLAYFALLINYGFDWTATREIAQNRNQPQKINEIFNNVLFSKIFLFAISTLIFLGVLFSVEKINRYQTLYLLMYFGGIFNIFFPTWFFQGIEKLNFTAIFTFIVRFLFTILIFVLIKEANDYLFYPLATIIGQAIVSLLAMYLVTRRFGITIKLPGFKRIFKTLKEGWRLFLTTVVINLYTTTNYVLLGFLASTKEVGLFTSAHKIIVIIMSLISGPMAQALFPNIGRSFSESMQAGIKKVNRMAWIILPLTFVPSLVIYVLAEYIILIVFGAKFTEAVQTLRIIAFMPLIIGLSNNFGIQGLVNLKKDKTVNLITLVGALIGISLNFILIPQMGQNGTAVSWLITELVITALMYIAYRRAVKNF
jgi:PST family polysaccharide transporter